MREALERKPLEIGETIPPKLGDGNFLYSIRVGETLSVYRLLCLMRYFCNPTIHIMQVFFLD